MCDGSFLAQLGLPDMRVPIEVALLYPNRADFGAARFDLLAQTTPLTFEAPDESRFPSLGLARRAAHIGGTLPVVMNGANEAAVSLFLEERIAFPDIIGLTERVMDAHSVQPAPTLAQTTAADRWARDIARQFV